MKRSLLALAALAVTLSGCTEIQVASHIFKRASASGRCEIEGTPKVGSPYWVDGIRYKPMGSSLGYSEKGIASWYGDDFHGHASANGECYNMYAYTAAHKTLPLPTIVRVTNLENHRSVVVKVNDRGPFVRGRIIDLSYAAAHALGMIRHGTAPVLVEAIGGPFNYADGYHPDSRLANTLGPQDEVAQTLPSSVPSTISEENLPPEGQPQQPVVMAPATPQAAAKVADVQQAEHQLGLPHPATNIPAPPPQSELPSTDTQPLHNTRIYVQVGAYANPMGARSQQEKLAQNFSSAAVTPVQSNGRTLMRVRAGPFDTIAQAETALDAIVALGFNAAQIQVENK